LSKDECYAAVILTEPRKMREGMDGLVRRLNKFCASADGSVNDLGSGDIMWRRLQVKITFVFSCWTFV